VTEAVVLNDNDSARAWLGSAFSPDAAQWVALERYAAMIEQANATQNLVSTSTLPLMWARHIADSAQLLCHDGPAADGLWLDLGSGAGLPGVVIAILTKRPVWLVESRALRCRFLEDVVAELRLGGRVTVAAMPLARLPTTRAATISARAFAPLDRLIDLSARFSTDKTRWLLPKGQNAAKELALLTGAWQKLFHVEQSLTDADSGIIVGTGTVKDRRKTI
jgi:16S rRNA (guanine527-N7)-methyltransferase